MNENQLKRLPFLNEKYNSSNISYSISSDEENDYEDDSLSTISSTNNNTNNVAEEGLNKVFNYFNLINYKIIIQF